MKCEKPARKKPQQTRGLFVPAEQPFRAIQKALKQDDHDKTHNY